MSESNPHKKEPPPDQEQTVSSSSSVQKRRLSARDRQEIERLERRMSDDWHAVLPSWLLQAKYNEKIGPALWLLVVIMRTCDWNTGELQTTKGALALWLGVNMRTIKNYLKLLDSVGVRHERGYGSDLYIFLPDNLTPAIVSPRKVGRKIPPTWQNYSSKKESGLLANRNNRPRMQSIGEVMKPLDGS